MDYDVGSAAFIVPRIGEHISNGLNTLRESFNFDDSHSANGPSICSPIFQSVNEASQDDILTFDHQEEVIATTDEDSCALFSYDVDNINPSLPQILPQLDPLITSFQYKPDTDFSDIPLPDDVLDLCDAVQDGTSFSNASSEPQVWNNSIEEEISPHESDMDYGDYEEIEEYVEKRKYPVTRKPRQKSDKPEPVVYLHNEDLAHGKPVSRLIFDC